MDFPWFFFSLLLSNEKCINKLQEDFEDDIKTAQTDSIAEKSVENPSEEASLPKPESVENPTIGSKAIVDDSTIFDLLDITTDEPTESDCLLDIFSSAANGCKPTASSSSQSSSNILAFDFLKKMQGSTASPTEAGKKGVINKPKMNDKKATAWMDLFADLDPLANPTTMEKKIAGLNQNCLDA